jgi:hypothetical protein
MPKRLNDDQLHMLERALFDNPDAVEDELEGEEALIDEESAEDAEYVIDDPYIELGGGVRVRDLDRLMIDY